jgi:hypothetical protein
MRRGKKPMNNTEMLAPRLIGSSAGLERPALIVNKIKALGLLKINAEIVRKALTWNPDIVMSWQMSDGPVTRSLRKNQMKFVKVQNRRGFNHNHGTKYTVTDLNRSNETHNFEAGTNRMPRRDSKFWSHNFMVWDAEASCQICSR